MVKKPIDPNIPIPNDFGGTKTPYSNTQIQEGYQDGIPQVVDGGNINYEKNMLFQNLNYMKTIADFINKTPIGKFVTVNKDNELVYIDIKGNSGIFMFDIHEFPVPITSSFLKPLNEPGKNTGFLIEHADVDYPDFWEDCVKYKNLGLAGDPVYLPFSKTQSEYDAALNKNAINGKRFTANYVVDEVAKTVRMPFHGDAALRGKWDSEPFELTDQIQKFSGGISRGVNPTYFGGATGIFKFKDGTSNYRDAAGSSGGNGAGGADVEIDLTAAGIRSGDETRVRSIGVYRYMVVANTGTDVDIVDLQAQMKRYVDEVLIPQIEQAGVEASEEARSWAIGDETDRPEGSAKEYAKQAAASAGILSLPLFYPIEMKNQLVGADAYGKPPEGSLVTSIFETAVNKVKEALDNGETKPLCVGVNGDIIGTPVVTEDMMLTFCYSNSTVGASGLKTKQAFRPGSNSWAIRAAFTTRNDWPYNQSLIGIPAGGLYGPQVLLGTNGRIYVYLSSNGTSYNLANAALTATTLSPNTKYWTILTWNGTQYRLRLSTDGTNFVDDWTLNSTVPIFDGTNNFIVFGNNYNSATSFNPFNGYIDLKETYININGERWADTVKYIWYKYYNGMRVVDIADRAAITSYADTYKDGEFYVYDSTNSQFYLPTNGERKLIRSWVEGNFSNISCFVDLYDDGWVVQRFRYNATANNIRCSFPVKMRSTDYMVFNGQEYTGYLGNSATIDTATKTVRGFTAYGDTAANLFQEWTVVGYADMNLLNSYPITYRYRVVANTKPDPADVDVAALITQVTENADDIAGLKAGTAFDPGIAFIIDSDRATDGTWWWRKWSDGYIEQGGYQLQNAAPTTVNLKVPMSKTDYQIMLNLAIEGAPGYVEKGVYAGNRTNNSFQTRIGQYNQQGNLTGYNFWWEVKGY